MNIIVVGDSTDHGGKVISGSPLHDVDGKPIARLGDPVDCPQQYPGGKPHGVNKIVTAHPCIILLSNLLTWGAPQVLSSWMPSPPFGT